MAPRKNKKRQGQKPGIKAVAAASSTAVQSQVTVTGVTSGHTHGELLDNSNKPAISGTGISDAAVVMQTSSASAGNHSSRNKSGNLVGTAEPILANASPEIGQMRAPVADQASACAYEESKEGSRSADEAETIAQLSRLTQALAEERRSRGWMIDVDGNSPISAASDDVATSCSTDNQFPATIYMDGDTAEERSRNKRKFQPESSSPLMISSDTGDASSSTYAEPRSMANFQHQVEAISMQLQQQQEQLAQLDELNKILQDPVNQQKLGCLLALNSAYRGGGKHGNPGGSASGSHGKLEVVSDAQTLDPCPAESAPEAAPRLSENDLRTIAWLCEKLPFLQIGNGLPEGTAREWNRHLTALVDGGAEQREGGETCEGRVNREWQKTLCKGLGMTDGEGQAGQRVVARER